MERLEFVEAKTSDGITLAGITAHPRGKKRTALIWLHGLTSAFYHGMPFVRELSKRCTLNGLGYFKFNNRGHDIAARSNKKTIGVAYEDFKKCVLDIKAMIACAHRCGYKNVILAGHSTGANKIVYYMYRTHDRRVKGLLLAGGLSDIAADWGHAGRRVVERVLRKAKRLRRRDPNALVWLNKKMYCASRFISLYNPGEAEDVFPVYNPNARWTAMKSLRSPLAVVFGSRDEHMDRSAKELIELYRIKAKNVPRYDGSIIRGADHSFVKHERELARCILQWMMGIV
ncbi:MAG: alpha/beta fold hydrolase [Candidatus Kerfeldbacteria bacterium]